MMNSKNYNRRNSRSSPNPSSDTQAQHRMKQTMFSANVVDKYASLDVRSMERSLSIISEKGGCLNFIHKSPTLYVQTEERLVVEMMQSPPKWTCIPFSHFCISNLHAHKEVEIFCKC